MISFIVSSLFALPYMLLFFVTWIVASLIRPVIVLAVVSFLSHPYAAWRKTVLVAVTFQYMFLCNDKKWKDNKEYSKKCDQVFGNVDENNTIKITTKTIVLVRHGESTWNDTFNKGDRSSSNFITYFIPNLIKAILFEVYYAVIGTYNDSWFFDAPLSNKGINQAMALQKYLATSNPEFLPPKEAELLKILANPQESQFICSNLRRAITTLLIGFAPRLQANKSNSDSIIIHSSLQEISRNPDALTISPAYKPVVPASTDPEYLTSIYSTHVNTEKHAGNKALKSNGLKRLHEFCRLAFDTDKPCIIAVGHSLWFRSFFRTFLPESVDHISKRKKLVNGGAVALTLQHANIDNVDYYQIDPKSINVLHGGF